MKRKLTYLLGLLLTTSAVWAGDCVESVKGFHGPLDDPYQITTNQYITINPTDNHSKVLPLTPNENFTVYAVDAGRVLSHDKPSSTVAQVTIVPSASAPYLALWFATEVGTGTSGSDSIPATGSIRVKTPNGVIGKHYEFNGHNLGSQFTETKQYWNDSINLYTYYCPWQFYIYDLTPYIGQSITIEIKASTCSTRNCSSVIYAAFDCFTNFDDFSYNVCYACDEVNLHAPSGNQSYAWHVGSFSGPVVGTDSVLILPGKWNIANYYCEIQGAYGELKLVAPVQDVRSVFSYDLHCGKDDAKDTVYFTNTSFKQKRIAPYTMEACDTFYWDFGNGQTSTQRDPGYVLYNKGQQVTVRLRTGTEDFACDAWSDATFRTCDKEDSIPLNPLPLIPVTDSIDSVVCHGTIVEWRDMYLTETGIYRDTLLSKMWGIDSIYYVLNLTVLAEPVEIPLLDTASCQMIPFMWRGHQIVSDTTCYDTIRTTKLSCDSIYASLRFKTLPTYNQEVNLTVCDKQMPYTWNGIKCETAGDYVLDSITTLGCDSIVTLHLSVDTYSASDTSAYICFYDLPFIWHGKVAQDGDTIHLINSVDCDSIVTLRLFVSPEPKSINKDTSMCQGDMIEWHGQQISSAGTYYDTAHVTMGNGTKCDSIWYTLNVTINPITTSDTTAYTCYGVPFIWHGKEAKDGDTIMLINRAGCDSIVTLHLFVSATPVTLTFDTLVCDTLLPYTWRGHTFYTSSIFRDTIPSHSGCDSIYRSFTLDTIHCVRPEPPVPPEPPVDTCVSNLVYRKWVDFIFCDNGRDEFVAFQWYRNNLSIAGETGQYLYLPGTMGAAEYFVEATKTDGSKIRTCPKTFGNTPRSRDTYVNVQTVIRRGQPLQIAMSDPEADVVIYTVVGQSVLSAHILGPETSLPIALPAGTYVLLLHGENVDTTTKIIVE